VGETFSSALKAVPASMFTLFRVAVLGMVGWAFNCSPAAWGAIANVSIQDNFFSPSSITINANDQVKWTWNGAASHSSSSDAGDTTMWDSGILGPGSTFSKTFPAAGSFPYHCNVHFGQSGSVTVQAANVLPTVTITNPANGAVFSAPATFAVVARASDSDGSITNVQFRQGATILTNRTSAPYSAIINKLAAGNYTFSAVASDNRGAKATNSISLNVVTPAPTVLNAPQRASPTSFQFSYSADVGLRYVVERSFDLVGWTALGTNTAGTNSILFLDNNASGSPGFYRVGRLPNP